MSLYSRRPGRPEHLRQAGWRAPRIIAALLWSFALLLGSAACGMNVQTNEPYTPAEGVNFDVGDATNPDAVVHVRNLLIIAKGNGVGIVSASVVTGTTDTLTALSGKAIKADGSAGAPFTASIPAAVALQPGLTVLTNGSPITVQDPDLVAGLSATMSLTFSNAGQLNVNVPVVDGTEAHYASITPAPSPSANA